ncbi:MAG: 9-O-acetylesterase, partial [Planctomycetia bacterium]
MNSFCLPTLCLAIADITASAEVRLHPLFSDHAVLQRDKELRVFGTAQPGERVEVSLGTARTSAEADASGRFLVRLPAQPMSTQPLQLLASAPSGSARADDILLGDVWLAGGQSNMEFP